MFYNKKKRKTTQNNNLQMTYVGVLENEVKRKIQLEISYIKITMLQELVLGIVLDPHSIALKTIRFRYYREADRML